MDPKRVLYERLLGTTLGDKYELHRVLGAGGMGAVFEALNTWTERRVAIKVLLSEENGAQIPRFFREARAASKIRHSSVVQILDVSKDHATGIHFMVMEYLEGQDLRSRLLQKTMSPKEALETLVPIMSALVAAHRVGVIHRDLKPENIFLARDPNGIIVPKLIDFGIAKVDSLGALTTTGTVVGTALYMSPEQARGEKKLTQATDIWGMGVVLYEAVSGQVPFPGSSYNEVLAKLLTKEATPLKSIAPELPTELVNLIHKALEKEPGDRYRTMGQFLGALLDCEALNKEKWFQALSSTNKIGTAPTEEAPPPTDADAPNSEETATVPKTRPQPETEDRTTLRRMSGERASGKTSRRSSSTIAGVAVLLAGVTGGAMWWRATKSPPATTQPTRVERFVVSVRAIPTTASIELDGEELRSSQFVRSFERNGTSHRIVVRADGYQPATITFTDEPPPPELRLDAIPPLSVVPDATTARPVLPTVRDPIRGHRPQPRVPPSVVAPSPPVPIPPRNPEGSDAAVRYL